MKKATLEDAVRRLEARGYTAKRVGNQYRCQCPAHGGDGLNLSLSEGDEGQLLALCHSHGCTFTDVLKALDYDTEARPAESKSVTKSSYGGKTIHPTLEIAVRATTRSVGMGDRAPDKIYRYDNEDGSENLFVLRWNTDRGKEVRPVSKVDGGYICGTKTDEGYPLYRLPQVLESLRSQGRIYVCEGEKATEAAALVGLPATCSAFGSKSAGKTKWFQLDDAAVKAGATPEIVILPDNDKPGIDYGEKLLEIFGEFESKPNVKVVSLSDFRHLTGLQAFPEGGDMADLLELLDGKTTDDIRHMVEMMVSETVIRANAVVAEKDPFPIDVLPISMARLCVEAGLSKNIDPVYVALPSLAAVAAAIGSAYLIALKSDWREPPIVWTCLICESGSGKTPGLDSAVEPFRLRQKNADHHYEIAYREYEREKEAYDLEYADYRRSRKARAGREPPEKPVPPPMETYLLDDATLEALCDVLEQNPHGVLLAKDELAGWFNSFDCYRSGGGSKDLASWLSLHGGKPFRVNRKTGKNLIRSDCPAVSLCGGIQPHVLQRIVRKNTDFFDSGLTARLLLAMPPDKPMHWSDAETSYEAMKMYENIFRTLLMRRRDPSMPSPDNPLVVRASKEALEEYIRFYNDNSDERVRLSGDLKASWAKFVGYVPRLALLFHVVERIEDGRPMDVLDADTMRRAIRLVQWFKRETVRILEFLRQREPPSETDDFEQRLIEFMEQKNGPVSLRDLKRKFRSEANDLPKALESMIEQGILEPASTEKPERGPKKAAYRLKG